MAKRGRPATGRKKRKALQLDYDLALKCPDIKALIEYLENVRLKLQNSKRSSPRTAMLFQIFDDLDKLPKLIKYYQGEIIE